MPFQSLLEIVETEFGAGDNLVIEIVLVRHANIVQRSEAQAIFETLDSCGGSRDAAARQLGISERTLRYRLASFREAGLAVAGGRR